MKLILMGYMGSGKSSVGKKLASKLKYRFEDLDAYIEKQEGKTISELFESKGEIYFRRKENNYVNELLQLDDNLVLATGGGTPCYGNTLELLASQSDCITIYLKTSLQVLTKRLFAEKNTRPLISHLHTEDLLNDFIRKHLFERSYYYNQAAMIVNTENDSINSIVEKIVAKLF